MATPSRPKWSAFDANVESVIAIVLDTRMRTDDVAQFVGVLLVWLLALEDGAPPEVRARVSIARDDLLRQWTKRSGLERAIGEEKRATRQLVASMGRALRGRRAARERAPDWAKDAARARAVATQAPAMMEALGELTLAELMATYVRLRGEMDDALEHMPPLVDLHDAAERQFHEITRESFALVISLMDGVFETRARGEHLRAVMTEQFRVPDDAAARTALLEPGTGEPPEGHSMLDERLLDTLAWVRVLRTIDERRMSRTVGRSIALALMTRHALFEQRLPSTPAARALLRTAVTRVDAMIERLALVWGRVRAEEGETHPEALPDVGAVLTRALRDLREVEDDVAGTGAARALADLVAAIRRVSRPLVVETREQRAQARFHAAAPDAVHAILDRWTERLLDARDASASNVDAFGILGLHDALAKLKKARAGKKRR